MVAARRRHIGVAVEHRHILVTETLRPDGTRPVPGDPDHLPAHRIEPHHLVVWAARWYLVAYDLTDNEWRVSRVDRLHPRPTTQCFVTRALPHPDLAHFVMSTHDRGDTPAAWQCTGTARLNLPAHIVARWAPGGSVVEHLDTEYCRLTLGAWSWAGIAGILATFDTEITELHPPELVHACRRLTRRWAAVADTENLGPSHE
ncbi:helix-turn-helix transcriptional regulator [Streptomyces cinereoruber]|uniref:helix-turn-helix transcriptional regulator n=1 Tax=Streptomyces cinereoruber TaxID=67260 RepID=UPI003396F3CA